MHILPAGLPHSGTKGARGLALLETRPRGEGRPFPLMARRMEVTAGAAGRQACQLIRRIAPAGRG